MTICMPRVGRNRIHLNQDYSTSRAKTRSRDYKDNDPGNESGKERHNNSKGHLIRTRNSFLFPLREKRSSRWKRGKEKKLMETKKKRNGTIDWTKNKLLCSTTSAGMESKTSHSQCVVLAIHQELSKKASKRRRSPLCNRVSWRIKKNLCKRKPAYSPSCSKLFCPEKTANRDRRTKNLPNAERN